MALIPQNRYDRIAMGLHWIIGALMGFMLFFGEDLIYARGSTSGALPSLHVTLGLSILVLSLARLAWRWLNPPPPLPAGMMNWEIALTRITHGLFYVLMIGLPLTGWLSLDPWIARHPAMAGPTMFGGLPIPALPDLGRPVVIAHVLGAKLGIALVSLHVLAALKHQFLNRDGLLRRMLPV
jgi:cytochrome b561